MPNLPWWPIPELILVFRHGVISLAIMAVVKVVSEAGIYLVPLVEARYYADRIDMYVLLAVLVLLAIELIWGMIAEFLRISGFYAILAA
jgi:hypothetical protein